MRRAAVSAFIAHVTDLMASWAAVTPRTMFGGFGIFRDGTMFAIVADDTLYLKADASTRARFAATGSQPFVYAGKNRIITMSYWRAPDECLDSPPAMRLWCTLAWDAALRANATNRDAAAPVAAQRRRNARTKS